MCTDFLSSGCSAAVEYLRCDENKLYMRTGMREALRQTIATEGNMHTHLAGRIGD